MILFTGFYFREGKFGVEEQAILIKTEIAAGKQYATTGNATNEDGFCQVGLQIL